MRIEAFVFGADYNHLCLDDIYLPFNAKLSCCEVEVAPFERQYFTAPHSRAELQQEELIATFFLCLMQKSDNFILRERLHLPCILRWQLTADSGIGSYQTVLYRPL